jgi:hypothetical protein
MDRREFIKRGTKILILTTVSAKAWEDIVLGQLSESGEYQQAEHWWAMFIDIEKCLSISAPGWSATTYPQNP